MRHSFFYNTNAQITILNITPDIKKFFKASKVDAELCHLFVKHTTCALIIMENEAGIKKDLKEFIHKIAPRRKKYFHDSECGDDNGAAHLCSEFLGQSLTIPLKNGNLDLGAWQNIFLIDFDNKPREREVVLTTFSDYKP